MSDFSIRPFESKDVLSSLALCRAAGWNQLQADWEQLFEHEPGGCFVAEIDGQLVGTVTTTRYGGDLAWIGMMLVHDEFRRLGIGTALMKSALQFLQDLGVRCIKLDATPAGKPVYQKLGFQEEGRFHRWSREVQAAQTKRRTTVEHDPARGQLETQQFELDLQAFGTDRKSWLQRLATRSTVRVRDQGFGMLRSGYLADYLGPVVALNSDVAREIALELFGATTALVFWDVPSGNTQGIDLAREFGFSPVRELTRMWTGSKLLSPRMDLQYGIGDPGTG